MMPPPQNVQNVLQGRSPRRSHNSNAKRKRRDGFFFLGVEKSFGFQSCFELLKRNLQRPCTFGLQVLGDQLQLPASLVDRYFASGDDLHPILRTKPQQPRLRAEHHNVQLRRAVFQREVQVPGLRWLEVRNLALDPGIPIFLLQRCPRRRDEITHGPHAPLGRTECKAKLFLFVVARHCSFSARGEFTGARVASQLPAYLGERPTPLPRPTAIGRQGSGRNPNLRVLPRSTVRKVTCSYTKSRSPRRTEH